LKKKGHTKRYAKVLEIVGRLREKYPRASKAFAVEVIPAAESFKDQATLAKDIVWKQRDAYEHHDKLDGGYLLRTDREDLIDAEIGETYGMLTRIETAFRALQSSLGLRPNCHQQEERAAAQLFISVLAYHRLTAVEHRLRSRGDHRSWASLREVLSTHQRLTIEYREKTGDRHQQHHLRVCSQPEAEHKLIYERLGLDPEPLPRTRYVGK
jgi:hypothetical protein